MRWIRCAALLGIIVLLPGAQGSAQQQGDGACLLSPAQQTSTVVRPGDAVRLRIWLDEEITGVLPVDERGHVVLPRIGARAVAGADAADVQQRLLAELSEAYRNTVIELHVLRRVLVRGAVREPGSFLLATYEATVGGALSEARGIAPEGHGERIEIIRADEVLQLRTGGGCRLAGVPLQSGDELNVPERPWYQRNPAIVATLGSVLLSGLLTMLIVTLQ